MNRPLVHIFIISASDATSHGQIAEYSPTLATCTACHAQQDSLVTHARSFGGVYQSDASGGRIYQSGQESCAICHAVRSLIGRR
nr:hypothetical protein [Shewanella morhuae]